MHYQVKSAISSQNDIKSIKDFWDNNYVVNEGDNEIQLLEVIYHFQRAKIYSGITYEEFCEASTESLQLTTIDMCKEALVKGKPRKLGCYMIHQNILEVIKLTAQNHQASLKETRDQKSNYNDKSPQGIKPVFSLYSGTSNQQEEQVSFSERGKWAFRK